MRVQQQTESNCLLRAPLRSSIPISVALQVKAGGSETFKLLLNHTLPLPSKGKLVYANYGTVIDYQLLSQTMNLKDTIAITKYGGTGRADKVSGTSLPYFVFIGNLFLQE